MSGRITEYLWHIIFSKPDIYCVDAKTCFCEKFGLCDLNCPDRTKCEGRWYEMPFWVKLPKDWPRRGQDWDGIKPYGWWQKWYPNETFGLEWASPQKLWPEKFKKPTNVTNAASSVTQKVKASVTQEVEASVTQEVEASVTQGVKAEETALTKVDGDAKEAVAEEKIKEDKDAKPEEADDDDHEEIDEDDDDNDDDEDEDDDEEDGDDDEEYGEEVKLTVIEADDGATR